VFVNDDIEYEDDLNFSQKTSRIRNPGTNGLLVREGHGTFIETVSVEGAHLIAAGIFNQRPDVSVSFVVGDMLAQLGNLFVDVRHDLWKARKECMCFFRRGVQINERKVDAFKQKRNALQKTALHLLLLADRRYLRPFFDSNRRRLLKSENPFVRSNHEVPNVSLARKPPPDRGSQRGL
jgi:hypothetical protein